jgi:predicted metal-dependent hydrolase
VSEKKTKVSEMIQDCHGRGVDPHYAGYFEYFNRGLFYEAHDVLEQLWLADRSSPNYGFYKGLIQLAGAFVHIQKKRPGPAGALFKLAQANLAKYPSIHEALDVHRVLLLIADWQRKLLETSAADSLASGAPTLQIGKTLLP